MSVALRVAVGLLLVWVAVEDMRRFRIRNPVVMALVAAFGLDCILRHRLDLVVPHGLFALLCFGVSLLAFRLRALGGGDAKLLTAAFLWVGPEDSALFALLLVIGTLACATGSLLRVFPSRPTPNGRTVIPFGPAIATAWIGVIALGLAVG